MSSLFLADIMAREHVADLLREAERERLGRAALGTGARDAGDRRPILPPTPGTETKPAPRPRWRFRPIG